MQKFIKIQDTVGVFGAAEKYISVSADFEKFIKDTYSTSRNEFLKIDVNTIIKKFNLKGFVFGNYVTQEERYHFLYKISKQLEFLAKVSGSDDLGKEKLIIAFGVKGRKGTLAHYNSLKSLINLNRGRKGKGNYTDVLQGENSFIHEYGHFLDSLQGQADKTAPNVWASEIKTGVDQKTRPFAELVIAINKEVSYIEGLYNKKKPKLTKYLQSDNEIFARVFESAFTYYVTDKWKEAKGFFEPKEYDNKWYLSKDIIKARGFDKDIANILSGKIPKKKEAPKKNSDYYSILDQTGKVLAKNKILLLLKKDYKKILLDDLFGELKLQIIGLEGKEINVDWLESGKYTFKKPESKPIVFVGAISDRRKIKDSIREGELYLKYGKDSFGKKLTVEARESSQRSINNSYKKLGIAPKNENLLGKKINCINCGWEWEVSKGGSDLYICHNCGYDNINLLNPTIKTGQKNSLTLLETKLNKYPFSKDDIPYSVGLEAHRGTSFSPEKRALSRQNEYFDFLKNTYDKLSSRAIKTDRVEEFEKNFSRYKEGYLKRYLNYLHSRSGLMSTMITGAGNFPFRRMQKKNDVVDKKMKDLFEYENKAEKYILPDHSTAIKTGQENSLKLLETKLKGLVELQEKMKALNALSRKYNSKKLANVDNREALIRSEALQKGIKDLELINLIIKGDKIPSYSLTNNNAKIKSAEQRVRTEKKLAALKGKGNKEYIFAGGKVIDNYEINKIQIEFVEKPSLEIRTFLKKGGNAFKWSPKNGVWQRQLNTYYNLSRKELEQFLGV